MAWHKKFGFKNNPFEYNAMKAEDSLIDYKRELSDLLYYVEAGSIVLLEGPEASGKTRLLKEVISRFGGGGRVIYVDAARLNKRLDVEEVLLDRNEKFGSAKGLVLLVDNAKSMSLKGYEKLQFFFDEDDLRSIVFVSRNAAELRLPLSLKDRIGNRVVKAKTIHKDELLGLLSYRLKKNPFLSRKDLEKIYSLSPSTKEFFTNAEKVGVYMAEKGLKSCTDKVIERALKQELEGESLEDVLICNVCGSDLERIGDNYRCEECDTYCGECGTLVGLDDARCPNCGVELED